MGGSAWVLRKKALGANMVALTSSVKAPPTALNLLAREQPRIYLGRFRGQNHSGRW